MLDSMRKMASGLIAKSLLLLLIASFAVWGIGDMFQSGSTGYAAKVGKQTISVAEFQYQRNLISRQLQALGIKGMEGAKLDIAVLRQLVQQKLIVAEMDNLGLYVSEDLLAQRLRAKPEFQKLDGSFDPEMFKATLKNRGMSEAAYLNELRNETAGQFLLASMQLDDVNAPEAVMDLTATVGNETRDAVLVTITPAASNASVSDADIKAFYDLNKQTLYLEPESRTLEYVILAPSDLKSLVDASINEQMLSDAAAVKPTESKEKLRETLRAEQREQVLRDLTNQVEDALAAGSSMGEAIAKAGVKAQSRLMEDVTAEDAKTTTDDIEKTVAEQGLRLNEGEISGLVTTPKGTTLMVAVKSITSATPSALEDVKADVKAKLLTERARDASRTKAKEVREALSQEPNWQAALAKFNVNSRVISNIARPQPGKKAPGDLPDAMQEAIFQRSIGEVAGPLTLENGNALLAVVLATHHSKPSRDAKTHEAELAQMGQQLSQQAQGAAFNGFMKSHKVTINEALMKPQADEAP